MSNEPAIYVGQEPGPNPADLGWYPPTFPVELALRVASVKTVCEAYGFDRAQWDAIRSDPVFQADLARACEMVKKDGMSFKLKAQLQSEELLKTSWRMIHAPEGKVPASVRADLLKFTIRAAGLVEDKTGPAGTGNNLQININLG